MSELWDEIISPNAPEPPMTTKKAIEILFNATSKGIIHIDYDTLKALKLAIKALDKELPSEA